MDKLAVREFVARVIGAEHLVPLIASYARLEHIAWHELPNRFVIKCSHGSHATIVCQYKALFFALGAEAKKLRKWLRINWYWYGREPPYRGIPPRVMIEELLGNGVTSPVDYKFMCFDGEPEIVQVHKKSGKRTTIDFFTTYGERRNMRKKGYPNSSTHEVDRMKLWDMLPIARALARATGAPYVRVDLYYEGGRVYFSELTFFDSAGFRDFEPAAVNVELGSMIDLGPTASGKGTKNARKRSQ